MGSKTYMEQVISWFSHKSVVKRTFQEKLDRLMKMLETIIHDKDNLFGKTAVTSCVCLMTMYEIHFNCMKE